MNPINDQRLAAAAVDIESAAPPGDVKHPRKRRLLSRRCCVITLLSVLLFSCFMLTIGVHLIANYVVTNMYAYQLDIRDFAWDSLMLGPITDSKIQLAVTARAGGRVPATVRIPSPLVMRTWFGNNDADGSRRYLSDTVMINDALVLSSDVDAEPVQLNLSMTVHDPRLFADLLTDLLSLDETSLTVGIDVWIPLVDVMWGSSVLLSILDISVNKTALLRAGDETVSEDLGMVNTVTLLRTLLVRIVHGQALPYINSYITMDDLVIYDEKHGIPPPAILTQFIEQQPELLQRQGRNQLTLGPPNITDAAPNVNNSAIMKFSLMVNFLNPTSIRLVSAGTYQLQVTYNDTAVVRILVPDIHLQPNSITHMRIYGFIHQSKGNELILTRDLPASVVQIMVSQRFRALPISISGALVSPAASCQRNLCRSPTLNSITQSVLANLDPVPIGAMYGAIRPTTSPDSTNSSFNSSFNGINQLFENIPVLGSGGLGDVLHGMRLGAGWGAFAGEIPVNIYLVNPFACAVAINDLVMRVYASRTPGTVGGEKLFLGWLRLNEQPIMMNPMSTIDKRWLVDSPFGSASRHLSRYLYPLRPKSNASSATGTWIVKKALKSMDPQLTFQLASSSLLPTAWSQLYSFFDTTLNSSQFRISLAVDMLDLDIGGFKWRISDIDQYAIEDVTVVPQSVVDSVTWPQFLSMVLGDGWAMTAPGSSAFDTSLNTG